MVVATLLGDDTTRRRCPCAAVRQKIFADFADRPGCLGEQGQRGPGDISGSPVNRFGHGREGWVAVAMARKGSARYVGSEDAPSGTRPPRAAASVAG